MTKPKNAPSKTAKKKPAAAPVKKPTANKPKTASKPPVEEVTLAQLREEESMTQTHHEEPAPIDPIKTEAAEQAAHAAGTVTKAQQKEIDQRAKRAEQEAKRLAKQAEKDAERAAAAEVRKQAQEAKRLAKQAEKDAGAEQRATDRAAAQERAREARNAKRKEDQAKRKEERQAARAAQRNADQLAREEAQRQRTAELAHRKALLTDRKAALKSPSGTRRGRSSHFVFNGEGFTQPQKFSVRGELLSFIAASVQIGETVHIDTLAKSEGIQLRGCDIRSLLNKLNESGHIDFVSGPFPSDSELSDVLDPSGVHFADHGNVDDIDREQ